MESLLNGYHDMVVFMIMKSYNTPKAIKAAKLFKIVFSNPSEDTPGIRQIPNDKFLRSP